MIGENTMEYLEIGARRDAYSVDDIIKRTLTVGELIEILEEYEDDTPVVLSHDGGYTYGALHEGRITLEETDEELDEDYEEEEEIEADDLFDESWDDDRCMERGWKLAGDSDRFTVVARRHEGSSTSTYSVSVHAENEDEAKSKFERYTKGEPIEIVDVHPTTTVETGRGIKTVDDAPLYEECLHCGSDDDEDDDFECDDDFGKHENSHDVDEAYSFKGLNDNFGGKTLAESLRPRAPKRRRK